MFFTNRYFLTGILSVFVLCFLFLMKSIVSILFLSFMVGFFIYSISIYVRKIVKSELIAIIISSFMLITFILSIILYISPFIHNELQPMFQSIMPKISPLIVKWKKFFNLHFGASNSINDAIHVMLNNVFSSVLSKISSYLQVFSIKITSVLSHFIIVFVLGFLSAIDRRNILNFFIYLLPRRHTEIVKVHVENIIGQLYQYIKLQISICIIFSIYYSLAFPFVSLPIQLAVFIGIMSILPYIGFTIGIVLSMLMLFSNDVALSYYVAILFIYIGAVLIENLFIMPVLIKNTLGLSPVYVICSMMLIEKFLGVLWLIFALPICILLKFIIVLIINRYKNTDYYIKND